MIKGLFLTIAEYNNTAIANMKIHPAETSQPEGAQEEAQIVGFIPRVSGYGWIGGMYGSYKTGFALLLERSFCHNKPFLGHEWPPEVNPTCFHFACEDGNGTADSDANYRIYFHGDSKPEANPIGKQHYILDGVNYSSHRAYQENIDTFRAWKSLCHFRFDVYGINIMHILNANLEAGHKVPSRVLIVIDTLDKFTNSVHSRPFNVATAEDSMILSSQAEHMITRLEKDIDELNQSQAEPNPQKTVVNLLFLHHTTKNSKDLAGSYVNLAGANWAVMIDAMHHPKEGEDGVYRITNTKMRGAAKEEDKTLTVQYVKNPQFVGSTSTLIPRQWFLEPYDKAQQANGKTVNTAGLKPSPRDQGGGVNGSYWNRWLDANPEYGFIPKEKSGNFLRRLKAIRTVFKASMYDREDSGIAQYRQVDIVSRTGMSAGYVSEIMRLLKASNLYADLRAKSFLAKSFLEKRERVKHRTTRHD